MVNLFIGGQLIDQYADESVEIVSSVLDVQDDGDWDSKREWLS